MIPVLLIPIVMAALIMGEPAGITRTWEEALHPGEKIRLQTARSLDQRVLVYQAVSDRIFNELREAVGSAAFGEIPDLLDGWSAILEESCRDIQDNTGRGRNRRVVQYEIDLRKSILAVNGLKLQSTVEVLDFFDAWTGRAETVRDKMMDVLFPN